MKPNRYEVQIKAVKPRRVVTIARFSTLGKARACMTGLMALGFMPVISHKNDDPTDPARTANADVETADITNGPTA